MEQPDDHVGEHQRQRSATSAGRHALSQHDLHLFRGLRRRAVDHGGRIKPIELRWLWKECRMDVEHTSGHSLHTILAGLLKLSLVEDLCLH